MQKQSFYAWIEKILFRDLSYPRKVFVRELSRVVNDGSQLRIKEVDATQPETLDELRVFREKIYSAENPHLWKEIQSKDQVEKELDQRSFHFVARIENTIVGTLRVTPYPFEMDTITQSLGQYTRQLQNYLELNRLVVDPAHRNHGAGKKLSYAAYLKFHRSQYAGLTAICKKERTPTFQRLGMETVHESPIRVPERGNAEYFVLASAWHHFIRDMFFYYGGRVFRRWFTGKDPYLNAPNPKEIPHEQS